MTDAHEMSRVAEMAARAAGAHLRSCRSRILATMVTREDPADVVDAIEREARALIREVVLRRFPQHGFLEASADPHDGPHAGDPCWIVGALDGRTNYLNGVAHYAVSLAFIEDGEARLGVVYDPCRNEFFGAVHGSGAVANCEPMRCAPSREPRGALAATVFPASNQSGMAGHLAEFGRVAQAFAGVRRSCSTALEMAHLAAGRIDAFWEHDPTVHCVAAGDVLLRESGAMLHPRDGRPALASRSLLACTPGLFEPFLSLLAQA